MEIEIKTYTECLEIVREQIIQKSKEYGRLKKWCVQHELNYNEVVRLKNGKMRSYAPIFVQKLLLALGYQASMSRNYLDDNTEDIYSIVRPSEI